MASPAPDNQEIEQLRADLQAEGMPAPDIERCIREHFAPPDIEVWRQNLGVVRLFADSLGLLRWEMLPTGHRLCLGMDWSQLEAHCRLKRQRVATEEVDGLGIMAAAYAIRMNEQLSRR